MIFRKSGGALHPVKNSEKKQMEELIGKAEALGGSQNVSVTRITMQPQAVTREQYHKISSELYYVIKGGFHIKVNGTLFELEAGDSLLVAPGELQSIRNGDHRTVYLAVCVPAWEESDTVFL